MSAYGVLLLDAGGIEVLTLPLLSVIPAQETQFTKNKNQSLNLSLVDGLKQFSLWGSRKFF